MAIDRKVKFEGVAAMGTFRKLNGDQLIVWLDDIIHHFNKNDIKIAWLHLDNEFKPLKQKTEKKWKLRVNSSTPDEHVGDIERFNRTLEDRFCVKYHRLPYEVMPHPIIRHLAMDIPKKRNMFPKKTGILKY